MTSSKLTPVLWPDVCPPQITRAIFPITPYT